MDVTRKMLEQPQTDEELAACESHIAECLRQMRERGHSSSANAPSRGVGIRQYACDGGVGRVIQFTEIR